MKTYNSLKYPNSLVECHWLSEQTKDKNIRLYDCTTYLRYTDRHPSKPYNVESGEANYNGGHIPGSAFLDLQENLSDKNSPYKMTLPTYSVLENAFKQLGIGDPYRIILYSCNGCNGQHEFGICFIHWVLIM
jgi:thiosulfate/3-mercaptopyruvate sulfurtransferase